MINISTIISAFDKRGTLLKWLKTVEKALKDAVLESVEVIQPTDDELQLKFIFADGTSITTPTVELPRGPQGETGARGPQGVQGPQGEYGNGFLTCIYGTTTFAEITTAVNGGLMPRVTYTIAGEPDVVMYYMQTKNNYHFFSVARDNAIYMAWVSNSDVWSNNRYIYEKQSNRVNSFTSATASNQTYPTTQAVYNFCGKMLYKHDCVFNNVGGVRIISATPSNYHTDGIQSTGDIIICYLLDDSGPLTINPVPARIYRYLDGSQYIWVLSYQNLQGWVYITLGSGATLYATEDNVLGYFSDEALS